MKKFKTRIVYWGNDYSKKYYNIEYCEYYLIPPFWWKSLYRQYHLYDDEVWCDRLFSLKDAEETIKILKSINDIHEFERIKEI